MEKQPKEYSKKHKTLKALKSHILKIKERNGIFTVNESSLIVKYHFKTENKSLPKEVVLEPLTKMKYNFIFKDNQIFSNENRQKKVIISKKEIRHNGLYLEYKSFNIEFETGGYKTKVLFLGDINEIIENINYLIFHSVFLKHRNFENIKISAKTTTGSNKND